MPYTERDGIRTAADSDIKRLFERTEQDGLVPVVFYEGTIKNKEQFLALARSPSTCFFLLMKGVVTVGYMWLNRMENRTVRQHFCVFKEYWGESVELGRYGLKTVMNMQDRDGSYLFDLLTGYVPAWNERAIKFALKCGGKTHGKIPFAVFNKEKGRSEDAVFIYYTRGEQ